MADPDAPAFAADADGQLQGIKAGQDSNLIS